MQIVEKAEFSKCVKFGLAKIAQINVRMNCFLNLEIINNFRNTYSLRHFEVDNLEIVNNENGKESWNVTIPIRRSCRIGKTSAGFKLDWLEVVAPSSAFYDYPPILLSGWKHL